MSSADRPAKIVVTTPADFLKRYDSLKGALCCFGETSANLHRSALQEIAA